MAYTTNEDGCILFMGTVISDCPERICEELNKLYNQKSKLEAELYRAIGNPIKASKIMNLPQTKIDMENHHD